MNKNKTIDKPQINVKNQPMSKKIGFFSVILLVIGSSIGAGIFLKNGEILGNVQGSIVLAIIAWVIAIISILAMGLTLTEICSSSETNNQGIIGWVKTFNNRFFYKGAKNFMAFLYLPINFFVMPLYAIMTIQDAFGFSLPWWGILLIAFAIFAWFNFMSGLSTWAANIQNWVITSVKFLPLIFAALIGFILLATGQISGPVNPILPDPNGQYITNTPLFSQLNPVLGIFASVPAVFFAFDGFYATAGLQSQMKEPKKISMSMTIGLAAVAFIDILISVSLLLSSTNGKIGGIQWLQDNKWLMSTINVLIGFGILGIINGFAVYTPRFYEDLVLTKELPFSDKFINKLNPNKPFVGATISFILTTLIFIVFGLIGSLAYIDVNSYGSMYGDKAVGSLYSFGDLMANWTSILAFYCIVLATIGCLINRKTKKVKVKKDKYFIPSALVSVSIVGLGLLFIVIQTFANVPLVVGYVNNNAYNSIQQGQDALIGVIMTLIILFAYLFIMYSESFVLLIKDKKIKKYIK